MKHEKAIYYISDEDIEYAGYDPKSITTEDFKAICNEVAEYIDLTFTDILAAAIGNVAKNAVKL